MPIRINLLAEALAEEELRRRDPVKRSIVFGSLLVALSLVWFSSTWLESMLLKQGLNQIQAERLAKTNDYQLVLVDQRKIADAQKRLVALQQLSATRFLQGNLLNALQQIYVPSVQLTRLRIDQTYSVKEAPVPATTTKSTLPPRPGNAIEKITLLLDAKDISPSPGDQVNRFKNTLAGHDYFKANLELTNGVKLANISPPQTSFGSKPFVLFSLECRFPDQIR